MRRASLWVAAPLLLAGCWNFDDAYFQFCDGGRCVVIVSDAGGDGGFVALDGSVDGGFEVDAGRDSGMLFDAGSVDASVDAGEVDSGMNEVDSGMPTIDAGRPDSGVLDAGVVDAGVFDAGRIDAGPVDAGCRGYGQACGGGDCCAKSDAGISMACGRNNLCDEYAPDCRESGFDCTTPDACCGRRCESGRCAICMGQGEGLCTKATDCCPGYSCKANNICTYAGTGMPLGDRCYSASVCDSSMGAVYCDPRDAGPNDGVCKLADTCDGLGVTGTNCCPGLDAGANGKCCLDRGSWSNYASNCCSGESIGNRCTDTVTAYSGERCFSGGQCAGNNICNPVGLVCTGHLCMPQGLNLFFGCCNTTSTKACRFPDGRSCLLVGGTTNDANNCCSGITTGLPPNLVCTEIAFY